MSEPSEFDREYFVQTRAEIDREKQVLSDMRFSNWRALWTTAALIAVPVHAQETRFISVEPNVRLEVLDWGGTGRPLVLLAGLGNTAHIFNQFAPKLAKEYRVYGITRRGYGASSTPSSGYSADRLGDDVLAVIDSLKIKHPVLIGHSIAGQELSSIGSRHPETIAGLVYLDAGYGYAFYDPSLGDFSIDLPDLQRKLEQLGREARPQAPRERARLIKELLESDLPRFERELRILYSIVATAPPGQGPPPASPPMLPAARAIIEGRQKFTQIILPVLAIFALPHELPESLVNDSIERALLDSADAKFGNAQADAFAKGVRSARVVRFPRANHYVFRSNEGDVLREIRTFVDSLPIPE
ncbi:MAG: alpha/beta hydrolase [Gemmatimonadetes bacterium]|nr:alpha/beta hydrolase [Gemmatimonadota bacterium]